MKFYEKAVLERAYLKLIFDKLSPKYDYKTWMTPAEGYDVYDGVLLRFKKDTSEVVDRTIIEVKVRDRHYTELMLESIKYTELKKLRKSMNIRTKKECYVDIKTRLLYINVTPSGSYLFDLDLLNYKTEWKDEMHWVSTTDKSKGKILKSVTYLPVDGVKTFDVKTGDYVNPVAADIMLMNHKRTKNLGIVFTQHNPF